MDDFGLQVYIIFISITTPMKHKFKKVKSLETATVSIKKPILVGISQKNLQT